MFALRSEAVACSRRFVLSQSRAFAAALPPTRTELFINNEWVHKEKRISILNPSTGEEFMDVARASTADVDAAVKAARACFRSKHWGKSTTGAYRAGILRKMADELAAKREEFAILESLDNGKPLTEAEADIDCCVDFFRYYAGLAEKLDTEGPHGGSHQLDVSDEAAKSVLRKEPVGVIGAITPWNFPLMQAVVKVAPSIAAGCTIVLKPAETCTTTCLRLGDLALAAGLPAGALNVLSGYGHDVGQYLLDHKGVDRLSFTGSGRTGRLVLAAASKRLVPASLELGGKGAIVVFDDADLASTVDWIMCGIFMCTGQVCSATSRLLVQERIYDRLMQRLVEETKKIKVGDGLADGSMMGPLVSQTQFDIVKGFVDRAKAAGANVVLGGNVAKEAGAGYYYEPTIMEGLKDDDEAWVEEIFGPVLAVRKFSSEEEAVTVANDSPYGLSAAVITTDENRAARVAEQLDAGVVWKNCSNLIPIETPFGGFKQSGFGKEYGEMGLEEYLRVKAIVGVPAKYSWEWYVKSE